MFVFGLLFCFFFVPIHDATLSTHGMEWGRMKMASIGLQINTITMEGCNKRQSP